jgi:hypothetical protein
MVITNDMKTTIVFLLISSLLILIFSCSRWIFDEKLTLPRKDYTGNELKTNGYYYIFYSNRNHAAVFFLYKNGIILLEGGYSQNLNDIEKEIPKGNFKSKDHWGVFIVNGNIIQYENWIGSTGIRVCISKFTGYIVNDTTIHFTEIYNSEFKRTRYIDEVWHFKEYSPKPDSTNIYIK